VRTVRCAVAYGEGASSVEQRPLPDGFDGPLLAVEASAICGSDLPRFFGQLAAPIVLGHETVGSPVGTAAQLEELGVAAGERYLIEEYVPCGHCASCRAGRHRACPQTDGLRPGALKYGTTPITTPPGLWGGFSEYLYVHPTTVFHPVPSGLDASTATFALPLSNGIQWVVVELGAAVGESVLIVGPGQQGLACVIAAKAAGCAPIVVAGLSRDESRLATALALGADAAFATDSGQSWGRLPVAIDDLLEGFFDIAVDVSGAGARSFSLCLGSLKRAGRAGVAATAKSGNEIDLRSVFAKELVVRGLRGHGSDSVDRALAMLRAGAVDMTLFHSRPPFALTDVAAAFEEMRRGALQVWVEPWS
jgi:threonine dehydrogenase-like Zn-dependent dehydrogenase